MSKVVNFTHVKDKFFIEHSNARVAKLAGCSVSAVSAERKRRHIEPFKQVRMGSRIGFSKIPDNMFKEHTYAYIADLVGCGMTTVRRECKRRKLVRMGVIPRTATGDRSKAEMDKAEAAINLRDAKLLAWPIPEGMIEYLAELRG